MKQEKYRLTAGIIMKYENKIFFGLTPRGYWGMPQGGIEKGETGIEAAKRELLEETGISGVEWVSNTGWYLLHLPEFTRLDKRYSKVHIQKYQWFLALTKTQPEVTLSNEYVKYYWALPTEIMETVNGSFKEEMYRAVLKEFDLL